MYSGQLRDDYDKIKRQESFSNSFLTPTRLVIYFKAPMGRRLVPGFPVLFSYLVLEMPGGVSYYDWWPLRRATGTFPWTKAHLFTRLEHCTGTISKLKGFHFSHRKAKLDIAKTMTIFCRRNLVMIFCIYKTLPEDGIILFSHLYWTMLTWRGCGRREREKSSHLLFYTLYSIHKENNHQNYLFKSTIKLI